MYDIYPDKVFNDYLRKLNALYSMYDRWEHTVARKDHDDEFGAHIKPREIYFKRQYGAAWDEVLKLSRRSMEMMIFWIFNGNFGLEESCQKVVDEERRYISEIHQKVSPAKEFLKYLKKRSLQ